MSADEAKQRRSRRLIELWGPAPLAGLRYRVACAEAILKRAREGGASDATLRSAEAALATVATERPQGFERLDYDA